ncbi:MAG TPA: Uma2 family endonuclease [Terriglobia bacterium]|jgi:Uma2 family endonuclease
MKNTVIWVSVDEYLNTSYKPDMDYVDGVLVRRNVGTQQHGSLQAILCIYFGQFRKTHRIRVFPETRLLVDSAARRYRVPDLLILGVPYTKGRVVVDPPAVIVEIKSPEDTFDDIVDRCFDYQRIAVPNIVVMDPENRRAWTFVGGSLEIIALSAIDLTLPGSITLNFPVSQLFAEIDED